MAEAVMMETGGELVGTSAPEPDGLKLGEQHGQRKKRPSEKTSGSKEQKTKEAAGASTLLRKAELTQRKGGVLLLQLQEQTDGSCSQPGVSERRKTPASHQVSIYMSNQDTVNRCCLETVISAGDYGCATWSDVCGRS